MSKIINTFIIPIITTANIGQMLESLYKYTEPDTFRVIVIDQTGNDEIYQKYKHLIHLHILSYRNLGFSKAMNTGIRLSDTKYITLANDDVVFMDKRWWQGIMDTFKQDPRIIGVNPMSPAEGSFGWGHSVENHETWQPREGFVCTDETKKTIVPIIDSKPFFYKENYTPEEYEGLLKRHPVWSEDSCMDAICTWMTTIRTEDMIGINAKLGLLDEKFFPGGGEDMDLNARAYSPAWPNDCEEWDSDHTYRMVGTAKSWVWHKWSSSRNLTLQLLDDKYFNCRPRWNANEELWTPKVDVWGRYEKEGEPGKFYPVRRKRSVFIDQL